MGVRGPGARPLSRRKPSNEHDHLLRDVQRVMRKAVRVPIAFGGIDQAFNLGLGEVLARAVGGARAAARSNCLFYVVWRDQAEERISHRNRLCWSGTVRKFFTASFNRPERWGFCAARQCRPRPDPIGGQIFLGPSARGG
jgi:hypothetical protein